MPYFPRTPDDRPRIDVAETNLSDSIANLVPALRDAGFRVFTLNDARFTDYIYIAKNGCVGNIEYDDVDGYRVHFATDPDRKDGNGLIVLDPDNPNKPITDVAGVVRAAHVATGHTHRDVHNPGNIHPNDGWTQVKRHFGFERLIEVVSTPTEP